VWYATIRDATITDIRLSRGAQEESPGSIGEGQLLAATGGNPRESATETKPSRCIGIRVKRAGQEPAALAGDSQGR